MNDAEYLDALLSLPAISMWDVNKPQVSRDGKWVAWTWYRAAPAADVYAAPTSGETPPVRLTNTLDNTILYGWGPNSKSVIVGQDKDGNERVQLFKVDLARPGVMQPLTEPDPNFFIRSGMLHPNGRFLVYGANLDLAGREIESTWVYRHDTGTGTATPLARPGKTGNIWPRLSPTGEQVIYQRAELHPAGLQIWMVDINGQSDREILNFGADKKVSASWFPDGQKILFIDESMGYNRLGVYEAATGEVRWLVDDPARNIETAAAPFGTDLVVVQEYDHSRLSATLLDPQTGQETRLPQIHGNLLPIAPAENGEWVGMYYGSRQPQDVVRFSPTNVAPDYFTSLARIWERTDLKPSDLTQAEDFRWKAKDGLDIQGWLYRPAGVAAGTIVVVHGGPSVHSQDAINHEIQFFVRQGFNVLDPNYRGSTGVSVAFKNAIKADGWGGMEQEDLATGIQALIEAGIATPGKIGITGTSYGGYSSWHAITHFPPEWVAASAPICGMTDLVLDYNTTRPDLRPLSEEMMGGKPDQAPERYHERSPINFIKQVRGKLLIVQGMQDPNVSPENVRAVTETLEKCGIKYEILAFEDEGHGILKPRNQKTLFLRLEQFFAEAFAAGAA